MYASAAHDAAGGRVVVVKLDGRKGMEGDVTGWAALAQADEQDAAMQDWSTAGQCRRRRCARRSITHCMCARQPTAAPVMCLHTTSSSVCASDSCRLHSAADRFVARVRQAPRSGCG